MLRYSIELRAVRSLLVETGLGISIELRVVRSLFGEM